MKTCLPGVLHVRLQSCYTCDNCLDASSPCSNIEKTGEFNSLTVTSNGCVAIDGSIDDEPSLADIVSVGDIVAVVADDDAGDYYLIKITQATHVLSEKADDYWGNQFNEGATVEKGLYFEKKRHARGTNHSYSLIRRKRAIEYAVAVVYIIINSNENKIRISDIIQNINIIRDI
ncbi:uncharacterized protein LOC127880078 [Dreissena polymorpha]|uniref:Uncharacterized protein n=1 Tax=Dreissena polymorpha TaxID=45954 RepID=A0A9D4HC92_DREPO|nr:uncharacterized protein LOC127880078 [Dreissena polymorpha]KAH3831570.1 hypothetical protein DPMN_104840 [Dreissena polymorpha]